MRLFIAAALPADIVAGLDRAVREARSLMPVASWTRPEAQHLTMAFLGDQESDVPDAIAGQLGPDLAAESSVEARLSGCGFFPDERRPRVAWMGIEPDEPLVRIAEVVRRALAKQKIAFDEKPFRPHLTLARVKDRWRAEDVRLLESALSTYRSEPFPISEIVLYSSELSPKGARHTALRRFALAAS
jgi:RNA 2',3'-cyclic 3'-phosphodiesterase